MTIALSSLWSTRVTEQQLPDLAAKVLPTLLSMDPFCLWLIGDLGAGKTTTTRALLRQLGLPSKHPVTSPTFTYCNEYQADGCWFAHLDLYRATAALNPEDLGLVDARAYRGFFVEWPEKAPPSPILRPTHVLTVRFTDEPSVRTVELQGEK